jgi:hypothetical protein
VLASSSLKMWNLRIESHSILGVTAPNRKTSILEPSPALSRARKNIHLE